MKKSKQVRTILCVILAVTVLTAFAAMAAGGAGSKADPLVTLSYLTDTFTEQILDKVDGLLAERNAVLSKELSVQLAPDSPAGSGGYTAVTLTAGQTLTGEAGCEVLVRSGAVRCTGAGVLIDTTAGSSLGDEAQLTADHLYLMPESVGVAAVEGAALLVRGSYTVG